MSLDLTDPRTLFLYAAATKIRSDFSVPSWYDSGFLQRYEAAKRFLKVARPEALERFIEGFAPLRTSPDFRLVSLKDLFDAETFGKIRSIIATLPVETLEHHETAKFGRKVVHDHPYFSTLQASLVERVSELVGEPVEPGYNFLSLYSGTGICKPHMDEPEAKWTLDICIDQNIEWPIHFSQVVDWPSPPTQDRPWSPEQVTADPALTFEAACLKPNEAVIFAGSSQWHYRDAIPSSENSFCHLLFFHYHPKNCEPLVKSGAWAKHFDLPELDILVSAFSTKRPENALA